MKWWGLGISLGTFAVGVLFPAYKSVEALESSGTLDDSQWLTYWLLSAFLTIVERFGYRVLFMLPFYAEFKLALLAWLVLPYFNGASMIYDNARPYLIDFYNALRQTTDELRDEAENKEVKDLRTRVTKVRSNVSKALMDMYTAVDKNELDAGRLKSKLDELESTMDISSSTGSRNTASTYNDNSTGSGLKSGFMADGGGLNADPGTGTGTSNPAAF